ncbi:MAG: 50S ribosomal protein L6, partial [Acidimicrobiales bacterium]
MSRIGKAPIEVPSGVDVAVEGRTVRVKGPQGTLQRVIPGEIVVERHDGTVVVTRPDDQRHNRALHGLTRSLVANMVTGVTAGYVKELEIVGVGYRAMVKGPNQLELALGFSHP